MNTPRAIQETFTWPVRVYWEDTDAGGIVYYANYLKFFERARTEWLRCKGIHQHALRASTGGMFVVADAQVHYRKSAQLDDELLVTTSLLEAARASMTIEQQVFLNTPGAPVLLCKATIRAGWVNASSLKAERIPHQIILALT